MDYRFQVNLGGIIDLLSRHTYSTPQVFIRELLQNGADAITARQHLDSEYRGGMEIRLSPGGDTPLLIFRDNGIGLNEDEIHLFLATIGQTSKREEGPLERTDFIGQFGIGLLSCFVVSDEVIVITRSAKGAAGAIEWRGRADGTYSLSLSAEPMEPGTEVRLHCKAGSEEYFQPETVKRLAAHYGGLLRFPIKFTGSDGTVPLNEEQPPWKETFLDPDLERAAFLSYGRSMFGTQFFDYIQLRSNVGDVQGVAFVLPFSPSLATRKTHRVYLKNMLLSEQTEGLLPEWAFFVKCVVNANDLRPTASREAFYEDETLAATRETLGQQLRHYLIDLARDNPQRLQKLINLHFLSIKALAVADEDFFRIFMNWLPFETNLGTMTLTEYIKDNAVVRYVADLDQFRQTARIAAAQSLCIINAAYTYDADLLHKLVEMFPRLALFQVDGTRLTHNFEYLTLAEQDDAAEFMETAAEVLLPFQCGVEIRTFAPAELPALYSLSSEATLKRTIEATQEVTDSFWSSVLDDVSAGLEGEPLAQLCFNYRNPVVYKTTRIRDQTLLRRSIQMLYVQSILLSHRPLNAKEMGLLNEGLLGFIEWGADALEGWVQ
ncbi:MAG: molecular chaperone HtpG [Blastocatellia bacterium]|jgi:molecular chaperone HtpG|nr:molecular chaperone HtpG [Blastocatellia bacterium]